MISHCLHNKFAYIPTMLFKIISVYLVCINLVSANEIIYKKELSKLSSIAEGMSRLVFYGTNYGWYGLLAGGDWKPKIIINGRDIKSPNYRNIYFVLDIPAGEYEITTKYDKKYLKNSTYGVPYYHDLSQGYTLKASNKKTYYHEMTISKVRTNESFMHDFDYFLSLWRVEENSALPQIKRMTHWYKAALEASINAEEDEE